MKRLIIAAAVCAGLAWALWPAPQTEFTLGSRFTLGPAIASAAPPPSGGGLIMSKTCDSVVGPGATVNCSFVVTNRNTASAVTDLLVQNTDPQGVTTIQQCYQGGVPVNDLSRRGAPGGTDTCTGSFTETAWTCDNSTLFRDHLEGFADDLNEGPVSGEAFWTVEIYTCTPTNTPINTATPTPTATPRPLPDLAPYTPSGWSDSIIVNNDCTSNTDSSPLLTTQTLCVNWAGKNVGVGATWNTFLVAWYIDGVPQVPFYSIAPPFNPGDTIQLGTIGNFSIGSLSAGSHSITLTMDVTGTQPESDETNNSYTKNFTVVAPTATPTSTPTITPTRTFTPTGTITPPTNTPTNTPTPTITPRIPRTIPFRTGTATATATITPTGTRTPPSPTPTITATPIPACNGSGGMAVSVTGLNLISSWQRTGYTATASGGTVPYSYRWSCDFHKLSPVFLPGSQTTYCSFPAPGRYIVEVLVQDKNNNRAYCGTAVTVYQ